MYSFKLCFRLSVYVTSVGQTIELSNQIYSLVHAQWIFDITHCLCSVICWGLCWNMADICCPSCRGSGVNSSRVRSEPALTAAAAAVLTSAVGHRIQNRLSYVGSIWDQLSRRLIEWINEWMNTFPMQSTMIIYGFSFFIQSLISGFIIKH